MKLRRIAVSAAILTLMAAGIILSQNGAYQSPPLSGGGGGGGTVTSVSGTANQISVATGTTTPVISLSSTISLPGTLTQSTAGAASTSPVLLNGTVFTGGSGTTTFPYFYINQGAARSTLSTSGTEFGINAPSGFLGNLFDLSVNGGLSVFSVNQAGSITSGGNITASSATGKITSGLYATVNNCSQTASPAACGSAAAGIVQVAAAATSLQINTTAVTANSRFSFVYSVVGITPPANISALLMPYVSAISAGTSFTITLPVAPTTNPVNITYTLMD